MNGNTARFKLEEIHDRLESLYIKIDNIPKRHIEDKIDDIMNDLTGLSYVLDDLKKVVNALDTD